jgi:hypothetical protein
MIFATIVTTATAGFEGNSSHCFRQDGGETMMDAFTALLDLLLFFSDLGTARPKPSARKMRTMTWLIKGIRLPTEVGDAQAALQLPGSRMGTS